ncbi:PAS domain S-box protein [Mucilaginibacter calamicampi]|uniref:histidine kinase n=1 Tax=Mucilaginibacter calamicampi TaxID=1302352 RepID=A0ABW2YVA2_9SPHI
MAKTNEPAKYRNQPTSDSIIGNDKTFRKLIENSYSGIALLNRDLETIYRSPSAERINGWTLTDRMKSTTDELIHPDDKEMVYSVLRDVLQSHDIPKRCVFRSRHYNGHYIWIECAFTNMFHEPDVNGIVCNFIDITSQKLAEIELQKTVNELCAYKYALDEAAIVAITDQKGKIIHVNSNFCKISKYSKQELIGQDHRIINSSQHEKEYIRNLWVTIANGHIWKGELKNKAKDGSYYWVDTTIVPFLNDDGKPYQYIAIRSDITQRKKEESHLRLLESVITNTTDAVLITEAESSDEGGPRVIYANNAFTEMTGYTSEEIIGKTPRMLQGEKSDKQELDRLGVAMRQFEPCEITIIKYKKSGEEFWVNFSVSPVVDEQGNHTHFISIERDITERKKSEQQIAQLNERFTLISKATNDALFEWNFDKKEIWWSESNFNIFGFDPNKPIPPREEWLAKLTPESQQVITETVKNILQNSLNNWQYEVDYHKSDGTLGTLLSRGFVIRNEQGAAKRMLGSYQDITQQKNEERQRLDLAEAVAASLTERNTILESIGDAFFALDKNWVVTYWNKTAESAVLKTKEEAMGRNLWDVFPDALDSKSYKHYHEAIATQQSAHFEDYYKATGKWYEVSAYPSASGLSVYFKDITERKTSFIKLNELNQNLEKQAKDLAVSNAELEQFAYVASHDLQEPLRMVTGFLTQLEKKYGTIIDDRGKQYIHFAVDGAKRMRQIILDLLEFSRVGRAEDAYESVDIAKLINDTIALYRKQIEDTGAVIVVDNLPVIQTLRVPLRQVFQNLISNALKYQSNGNPARVKISFEEDQSYWKFAVVDNGIGIDSEYFDKIFIIFQRLHNKDEYSGTGMGLAVTKKIVESLGGRIWVESEEGNGSTFYFTIAKTDKP